MRNDKILAYKMRMKGQSYTEISKGLGMSRSTLSGWFRHLDIPKEAKEKIKNRSRAASINALLTVNRDRVKKAEQSASEHRSTAQRQVRRLSDRELMIAGVMLYWTEGHKRPIMKGGKPRTYHAVSFTNSDPSRVKLFLRFLRDICDVEDIKIIADLRIHKDQNDAHLLEFWRKTTGLGFSNFKKVYRVNFSLPYGTLQIRVNDTALFHRIMGWIEGLQNS